MLSLSSHIAPLIIQYQHNLKWLMHACTLKNTDKFLIFAFYRWSTNGLEFIVDACSQKHLAEMSENDFQVIASLISTLHADRFFLSVYNLPSIQDSQDSTTGSMEIHCNPVAITGNR